MGGVVRPAAGDHRHAAVAHFDRDLDDARCSSRQGRRLAGRAARNQRIAALVDLPLDQSRECVFIDTPAAKGVTNAGIDPKNMNFFLPARIVRDKGAYSFSD